MTLSAEAQRRMGDYPPYYETPAGLYLRLDQNANLMGPNQALGALVPGENSLHLYPSRDNRELQQAAAQAYGVPPDTVFVGNGSDEILDIILRSLVAPGGRVATLRPSYSMYPHLCRLSRLVHAPVPYRDGFRASADDLLAASPDLVLLANPNNPTGTLLPPGFVDELLDRFDGPVVLDEAYGDYANATGLPLVGQASNLVVTRTLSKAAGLAGLRVGFGFAHPDVAELIRRAKLPFAINLLSERLACRALERPDLVRANVAATQDARRLLSRGLERLGFEVVPSFANFVLTRPPVPAARLYEDLRRRGVLARVFPEEPTLAAHIRFTVPDPAATERLLSVLADVMPRRPTA